MLWYSVATIKAVEMWPVYTFQCFVLLTCWNTRIQLLDWLPNGTGCQFQGKPHKKESISINVVSLLVGEHGAWIILSPLITRPSISGQKAASMEKRLGWPGQFSSSSQDHYSLQVWNHWKDWITNGTILQTASGPRRQMTAFSLRRSPSCFLPWCLILFDWQ